MNWGNGNFSHTVYNVLFTEPFSLTNSGPGSGDLPFSGIPWSRAIPRKESRDNNGNWPLEKSSINTTYRGKAPKSSTKPNL